MPRLQKTNYRLPGALALEARLLVELGAGVSGLGDLARLVQVALGGGEAFGRLEAEVQALTAMVDAALGTVLEA